MNKWIKRILIAFIVVFLVARILWPDLFFHYTDFDCDEKKEMKAYLFNAVVIKKYEDYENHGYPVIVFKSLTNNKAYKIYFILERGGFFDNIQIGDTVRKQRGSLRIFSSNKKILDSLVYDCQEKNK